VSFVAEGVDPEKEKEASRYLIITDGHEPRVVGSGGHRSSAPGSPSSSA
jgi:hypothetical protein